MGMPDYFLLLCICKRLPIMGESGNKLTVTIILKVTFLKIETNG